jgi:FimV-like protein
MGDQENAEVLLQQVIEKGDEKQKQQAQQLLNDLDNEE